MATCGQYILTKSVTNESHLDLNYFEIIVASIFYQLTLYMAIRLAHQGFTLGELGLTCFGGTALCLEFLNLTIARVYHLLSLCCICLIKR